MTDSPLPKDQFSLALRESNDNPGAVKVVSTIATSDFYGNAESWIVSTFRLEAGRERVFLERNSADQPLRLVLPIEVTAVLASQRERAAKASRRRHGHKLVALRKQRGDVLGNPEALRKARKARRKRT